MRQLRNFKAYSYRHDEHVPDFDDSHPLIIFDGVCVLCTGFAKFMLKRDKDGVFHFATAQSPLGQGLFRHYGLDPHDFQTNLLIDRGRAYGKLDGLAQIGRRIGGIWRGLCVVDRLPDRMSNWLYDRIAKNRYALFGKQASCMIPPPEWSQRFLDRE